MLKRCQQVVGNILDVKVADTDGLASITRHPMQMALNYGSSEGQTAHTPSISNVQHGHDSMVSVILGTDADAVT